MVQMKLEDSLLENSFLFRTMNHFVLFRPQLWVSPTHIMEGNLPSSEFTDLNINLIEKHPSS